MSANSEYLADYSPDQWPEPGGGKLAIVHLPDMAVSHFIFRPDTGDGIWVNGIAVAPDSGVVLAGVHASESGVIRGILVELDTHGRQSRSLDLGDFEPVRVCMPGDGTLWVFGQDWNDEVAGVSYTMIRHISRRGSMLGSFLPRSVVHVPDLNLSSRLRGAGGGGLPVFFGCNNRHATVYIGGVRTFFDVTAAGRLTRSAPVQPGIRITGLARRIRGAAVAGYVQRSLHTPKIVRYGFYSLQEEPHNESMQAGGPVGQLAFRSLAVSPATGDPPMYPLLLSADGARLLCLARTMSRSGDSHSLVLWWIDSPASSSVASAPQAFHVHGVRDRHSRPQSQ